MTIRNLDAYIASLWDWGILDGCFGQTRIKPTDIDGFVERRGNFLLLEAKGPGKPVTQGQQILFEELRKTGRFTIVVIWGDPGSPRKIQVMTPKMERTYEAADVDQLRSITRQWWEYAERHPQR